MNGDKSISAYCCECQKETSCEIVGGDIIYPHRPDLYAKKFIRCPICKNYTGIFVGEKPTIPTEHIRRCRYEAHRALDEIWKNKKTKEAVLPVHEREIQGYLPLGDGKGWSRSRPSLG